MTRASIGQAAVRLYPADIRAARGEELVGTLLDAGDYSRAAFLRELMSLIVAGLVARSRDVHSQSLGQLALDVIRWAAVITVGRAATQATVNRVRWGAPIGSPMIIWLTYLAPALILAFFIFRRDRAAGITGLAWFVLAALDSPRLPLGIWIELLVLPLVGFSLMTIAPRRQPEAGRGLVLIPLVAWALIGLTELGLRSSGGDLLPVLAATVFVTIKPALALGTALAWASLAASYLMFGDRGALPATELLSCVLITLALTAVFRRRALTQPGRR